MGGDEFHERLGLFAPQLTVESGAIVRFVDGDNELEFRRVMFRADAIPEGVVWPRTRSSCDELRSGKVEIRRAAAPVSTRPSRAPLTRLLSSRLKRTL